MQTSFLVKILFYQVVQVHGNNFNVIYVERNKRLNGSCKIDVIHRVVNKIKHVKIKLKNWF